ncbi:MAG: hypothetical protein WAN36_07925 [Calditrichia bacterium]
MKKYSLAALTFLLIALNGCVKKEVYFPLPVTFSEDIEFSTPVDTLIYNWVLDPEVILSEVETRLDELSDFELNNVVIEGMAYTVFSTSNTATKMDAVFRTGGNQKIKVVEFSGITPGQIIDQQQMLTLESPGTDYIEQVLRKDILENGTDSLKFRITGSIDPAPLPGEVYRMSFRVEITISAIGRQCQEVFDLLGSDDAACN